MAIQYNMFRGSYMESPIGRPLKYRNRVNNDTMNKTRGSEYPSIQRNDSFQSKPSRGPQSKQEIRPLTNPKKRIKYSSTPHFLNTDFQSNHHQIDFIPDLFVRDYHNQMRIISSVTFEAPEVLLNFFPFTLLTGKILLCRYLNKFKNFFELMNAPPINMFQLYLIACSTSEKLYMECINRQYSAEQNRILNLFVMEMDFDLEIDSSELYAEWVSVK